MDLRYILFIVGFITSILIVIGLFMLVRQYEINQIFKKQKEDREKGREDGKIN